MTKTVRLTVILLITSALIACGSTPVARQEPVLKQPSELEIAKKKFLKERSKLPELFYSLSRDLFSSTNNSPNEEQIETIYRFLRYGMVFDIVKTDAGYKLNTVYIIKYPLQGEARASMPEEYGRFKLTSLGAKNFKVGAYGLDFSGKETLEDYHTYIKLLNDVYPQFEALKIKLLNNADSLHSLATHLENLGNSYSMRYDRLYSTYNRLDLDWELGYERTAHMAEYSIENLLTMIGGPVVQQIKEKTEFNLAEIQFFESQVAMLDTINKANRSLYELNIKLQTPFQRGDKVCDRTNRMGYVEDSAGSKLKILWVNKVSGEPFEFFFGNFGIHNLTFDDAGTIQYQVTKIQEIAWLEAASLGTCDFQS